MDSVLKDIISKEMKNKCKSKKHSDCLNCLLNCAEYRLTLQVTQNENSRRNNLFYALTGNNIPCPLFFYNKPSNEVIELIEKKNIEENYFNESLKIKSENEIIKNYEQNKKSKILLFNHVKFPLKNINTENNISKQSSILILDNGNHDMVSNCSMNSFSTYNDNYCLLFDIHNLKNTNNLFSIKDIKDSKEIKLKVNSNIHDQQLFKNDEIFYISPSLIINSIKKRMKKYIKYNDPKIRKNLYNKYFFTQLDSNNANNIGVLFSFNKRKNIENTRLNGDYLMNENYQIIKLFICLDIWADSKNVHETKDTSKSSSQKTFKPEYIEEENSYYHINQKDNNYLNNYNEYSFIYNNNINNNINNNNNYNNNYYSDINYNNNFYNNNYYSNNNNIYFNNNNTFYNNSNMYYNNNNNNNNYYNINNNYNKININKPNNNYNKFNDYNNTINNSLNIPNKFDYSQSSQTNRKKYSSNNSNKYSSIENKYDKYDNINPSFENNKKKPENKFENMEYLEGHTIEEYYELNYLLNNVKDEKNNSENHENSPKSSKICEYIEKEVNKEKKNEDIKKSTFLDLRQKYIKEIYENYKRDNCLSNYSIVKNKLDIDMNVDREKLKKIKLKYFFDCFKDINCLSLNIPYINKKGKYLMNEFNPTLSSMRLVLNTNEKTANKIIKQKKDNYNITIIDENIVKIEYEENKPVYQRDLLYTKLDEIKEIIKNTKLTFKNVLIEKSYFCVLWNITDSFSFTSSFLAYYSFDLKLIGIFIIKLNMEDWLSSFSYDISNYKDYNQEYKTNISKIKDWFNNLALEKEDGHNLFYFTHDYIHYLQNNIN